ncbi:MAG TPA: 4Fe-4S ferredoxin [bacterium (Candidatus Stahlbacteria)]|nr:4Fe-4S ferredoxin [Candidatus Stahlbacteria bacterium]
MELKEYRQKGVLKEINQLLPDQKRRQEGPYVVIECIERIPCDPCVESCPNNSIKIEGGVVDLPIADYDLCNGCLGCIARCPGLAIFVIDETYSETEGLISLPYEFMPRPKKGEVVTLLSRNGDELDDAIVHRVIDPPKYNKCAVITLRVKKEFLNDGRFFKRKKNSMSL